MIRTIVNSFSSETHPLLETGGIFEPRKTLRFFDDIGHRYTPTLDPERTHANLPKTTQIVEV